jgi:hypothetical protein
MRLGLATAEGFYASFCAYLQGSMLREELEDRFFHGVGIINLPASEPLVHRPAMPFLTLNDELSNG